MDFEFDPRRTALLVIDMQNDFLRPGADFYTPAAAKLVPRLKKLLEAWRRGGIPVLYTVHVHSPDGSDMGLMADFWPPLRDRTALIDDTEGAQITPDLAPQPGEPVIKKHRYSAFFGTDLEERLRDLGVEAVAIAGTVTNICCESTARDAQFRDFKVIFLSDCTGAMDVKGMTAKEVQKAVLASVDSCVAKVMDSRELIGRIPRTRGVSRRSHA